MQWLGKELGLAEPRHKNSPHWYYPNWLRENEVTFNTNKSERHTQKEVKKWGKVTPAHKLEWVL